MTHTVMSLQMLHESFTVAASSVVGTTYTVGPIPAGMKVKNIEVYTNGLGASVTLSVGVTGSTTLFASGLDVASAGKVAGITDTLAGGVGNVSYTGARNLLITTAGATTTGSAKQLDVYATLVPYYA